MCSRAGCHWLRCHNAARIFDRRNTSSGVLVVCTTSDLVWCVVQSCEMDAGMHAAPLRGGVPAVVVLHACSRLGWLELCMVLPVVYDACV